MSTLLTAEPEANFAECSRALSLQANQGQDGWSQQVKLSENDMMSEELSSFQIRNFVSTVRNRDISKCWPFRHKILEKCLSVGLKPFLPPFEPPLTGCNNSGEDHDISFSRLRLPSPRNARDELCKESEQQDCTNFDKVDSAVFDEKSLSGDKEASDVIGVEFSDKGSVENHSGVLDKPSMIESRPTQAVGITALENSQDGSANDFGTHPNGVRRSFILSECVDRTVDDEKMDGGVPSPPETITNAAKDSNLPLSTYVESEAGSVPMVTSPNLSDINGSLPQKSQQHHKGKLKSLSNECTIGDEQTSSHKSKSLKVGIAGKAHQDESQPLSEGLNISDQPTASCIERDNVGLPSRNCRNAEDCTFTGLNLDILVPQVCPVCLNFTSTSNTALNAHIDHCLESVLPGEKGESRACKSKINPRKMRSMADICATAPARTLEDLERSSKLWALHDEASKEDSSCTPSWKSGLIRRQPRTSLHRGPAWKAKNNSDVEDALQVPKFELQPQRELNSLKEKLGTKEHKILWTASRTCVADIEVELEQSCKDQQLLEEPGGHSHVASSIKPSFVRKKKKKQSATVIPSKEVLTIGGHCPSDEEQDDHIWSVPVSLLGFTPIDTSAEEEKRLQQKIRSAKGGGIEAETLEQQGSVNDLVSRSGKTFAKQCSSGSSLDLTDMKSPNEVLKKRKRTQTDNNWFLDEVSAEDVDLSIHSERPAKNRRAAIKIKSLLTVVANSCKDKGKDVFEGPGSQKKLCPSQWQEKTNDKGAISAPSGLLSAYQELNSKRKSSASVADEGCCEANKHARFRPSEQPATPDNLDSNNLSEHAKSPKGSSVSSGRALTEHDEMYRDRPPTCPEEEMPRSISAEEFANRNARGEELGLLMSPLSKHQAGEKGTSCALGKRNITNAKSTTEDVLVEAPPPSSDLSGLGENGSTSRFEHLRKAVLNAPCRKTCNINREEVLRNTSNAICFPEQASKNNLLASQILTACNSAASVGGPFSNMTSRENAGGCVPQLLSGGRKSFFSPDAAKFCPADNIRTNQMAYDSTAACNFPNSMTRDNQVSLANLSPLWSENSQHSASTCAKFVRNNGQPLTAAESLKSLGNCALKSSVKHGVQQACFLAGDSFERLGSNGNESSGSRPDVHILENGSLFVANRMDKFQGHNNSTESLQRAVRAANCTMGVESPHQSQQEYIGSRFLSSELGPVHLSSASEALQENGHNYNCESNGHDCAPLPGISTERMSLPSSLLADLARTMVGSSMNAQDPLPPSNCFIGEQSRTSNTCLQCTPKNLNRAREYLNLMPLQGIGKPCHPSASNGTVQPQLLHTSLQTMKGHTSTINSERVHHIGGNMDVSMKLCNTLSSVSPYRVDHSNASMIGNRESLLGGELTSNLNNYGTVEYSGDQGVVHIFGSPVFKLMGQNVIVTNSSIKALGMESACHQNGAQSFHPSSSIRHLGVVPETQNHYSHKLSQELFSSSRLEAWHGDACMQRSHSFLMDSLEINPHTLQNLPPAKSVQSKMLVYKEPAIPKPQMPVCILGERSTILSSTGERIMKKPMVAHAVNKRTAEVFTDIPPSGGTSLSAAQSRGKGMVTQQNDRNLTANSCSVARNEPLVQSQPHTLQSTSAVYLGDTHKLDVSGSNTRYRSGTLADIVQSSERSNN